MRAVLTSQASIRGGLVGWVICLSWGSTLVVDPWLLLVVVTVSCPWWTDWLIDWPRAWLGAGLVPGCGCGDWGIYHSILGVALLGVFGRFSCYSIISYATHLRSFLSFPAWPCSSIIVGKHSKE